jgi:hypothetical protein
MSKLEQVAGDKMAIGMHETQHACFVTTMAIVSIAIICRSLELFIVGWSGSPVCEILLCSKLWLRIRTRRRALRIAGFLLCAIALGNLAGAMGVWYCMATGRPCGIFIVSVFGCYMAYRLCFSVFADGADQAVSVVLLANSLYFLWPSFYMGEICLWFLAVQVTLSYVACGVAKLSSQAWRQGRALQMITSTKLFGSSAGRLLFGRLPVVGFAANYFVIAWECAFPIVLIGNDLVVVIMLALGVGFHLGVAVVMRLNHFPAAFMAFYPAVLYCCGSHEYMSAYHYSTFDK